MKSVPTEDILLFRSCLVSVEYPGVEASTKFVVLQCGQITLQPPSESCMSDSQ